MGLRVLVTGGAGFIGSHVANAFVGEGSDVSVLDDLSSGKREQVPNGAKFHHLDIGSADAARLVRDGRFDVICHLAAQIDEALRAGRDFGADGDGTHRAQSIATFEILIGVVEDHVGFRGQRSQLSRQIGGNAP